MQMFDRHSSIKFAKIYKEEWSNISLENEFILIKEIHNQKLLDQFSFYLKSRERIGYYKKASDRYLVYVELNNGNNIEFLFLVEKDFSCVNCIIVRNALYEKKILVTGLPVSQFSSEDIALWLKNIMNTWGRII